MKKYRLSANLRFEVVQNGARHVTFPGINCPLIVIPSGGVILPSPSRMGGWTLNVS